MSIIDHFLSVFAPYECLSCATEGKLLCVACIQQLSTVSECCYRCSAVSPSGFTCYACRRSSYLYRVRSAARYQGAAKQLVGELKFNGAQAAAVEMAAMLRPLLVPRAGMMIMPVPTATTRVRQRGYDQAKLLARALSRHTHLPYLDYLARSGQTHQVGASRQQRRNQLTEAFRVRAGSRVQGMHVLLIDDVMTTGATLEAAAACLKAAGAELVEAVVFAQA